MGRIEISDLKMITSEPWLAKQKQKQEQKQNPQLGEKALFSECMQKC